jgi:hypothetical protein
LAVARAISARFRLGSMAPTTVSMMQSCQLEGVFHLSIEAVRPDMAASRRLDQLAGRLVDLRMLPSST